MIVRMRPLAGAALALAILLTLLAPGIVAAEPVPFEDWQDGLIHASRWQGSESFGGQEVVREVTPAKQLELRHRRQGFTASNSGGTSSGPTLLVNLANNPDVIGLEAAFTVTDLSLTTCAANNSGNATRARPARLVMGAFNDGTQAVAGNRLGDIGAVVQAFRDGSSANPPGVLNVQGTVFRCTNASCGTNTTLLATTLATTVALGQTFTLRLRWDQANHRFLFGLDAEEVALPYAVTDVDPANFEFVDVEVNHTTANCTAGPVAVDSTALVGAVSLILPDPIFGDVARDHPFFGFIEALSESGITGGCATSPLQYCPDNPVTRGQMAVFLLRGIHGAAYQPPPATGMFTDVPISGPAAHPFANWIEQLAREGITTGCGPSLYCPGDGVTRGQMAVFLLRAEHGAGYQPPAATGMFTDVPISGPAAHPFANWIEQLAREGITGGCGPSLYCPGNIVTRGQMAVFLVRAFNLPM